MQFDIVKFTEKDNNIYCLAKFGDILNEKGDRKGVMFAFSQYMPCSERRKEIEQGIKERIKFDLEYDAQQRIKME